MTLEPRFCAPFPAITLTQGMRMRANFQGPFDCFPNELNEKDFDGIVAARSIL
jgi:hypothetical protein